MSGIETYYPFENYTAFPSFNCVHDTLKPIFESDPRFTSLFDIEDYGTENTMNYGVSLAPKVQNLSGGKIVFSTSRNDYANLSVNYYLPSGSSFAIYTVVSATFMPLYIVGTDKSLSLFFGNFINGIMYNKAANLSGGETHCILTTEHMYNAYNSYFISSPTLSVNYHTAIPANNRGYTTEYIVSPLYYRGIELSDVYLFDGGITAPPSNPFMFNDEKYVKFGDEVFAIKLQE